MKAARLRHRRGDMRNNSEAYEHPSVLCFAARNRRGRFYIPMTSNSFGGIPVEHVLLDSGCSSLLLPFPLQAGIPAEFVSNRCGWIVSSSRGTGAVHSPVLKITRYLDSEFALTLADKVQPRLKFLRFHLGSEASNTLLNTPRYRNILDETSVTKLVDFLREPGHRSSPERTYALLGQAYLRKVMYCQKGDVALTLSNEFDGNDNIIDIMSRYNQKLMPLVEQFEAFDDLEEDDGDEDEEDYRLCWDENSSGDEIDEPDDR